MQIALRYASLDEVEGQLACCTQLSSNSTCVVLDLLVLNGFEEN
jgi:hypothetical protein